MSLIASISILAILAIANIIAFVFIFRLYKNYKTCEQSESVYCPGIYCSTADPLCGHHAFRTDASGNKVCQKYLVTNDAPVVSTPTSGSNV